MATTLYRKYRPKVFGEMIGQNHIKTTLQNEIESGSVAHAYLFSGPRGLGKTTTARLLAKSVNCLDRKEKVSEPCNKCRSCQEILNGNSIDVIEIDAASHTGVDNVRENIIENSRFTPGSSKFKVFIIDEVHMLSISAFNALLKTLEEPPAHAIFILATTEIHKVPQTIISRCQHFEFRPVTTQDIVKRLDGIAHEEKKKVDEDVLESIAYYSSGSIRDAESLLGQILTLDDKKITIEQAELVLPRARFDLALELLDHINKKDATAGITLINNLVEDGINLEKFTDNFIEILRKVLLVKVNDRLSKFTGILSKDLEKKILEISKSCELGLIVKAIEVFLEKRAELKQADIIQLPLEVGVIEVIGFDEPSKQEDKRSVVVEELVEEDKFIPEEKIVKSEIVKEEKVEVKAPVAKIEKKEEPKEVHKKIDISFSKIKEKWHDVLDGVKFHNHSLATTLKIGQLSKVHNDGSIELVFQHDFHSQRVNDIKNRQVLENVLKDIFGLDLRVKTVIVKNLENEEVEAQLIPDNSFEGEESIDDLAAAFGGQVLG